MLTTISTLSVLAGLALAQFPPPAADLQIANSEIDPEVQISYKQFDPEICETTPGVRSFSGYVHLPNSALSSIEVDFDIHTFFLFFEARNNAANAPLAVYLAGGPGEASSFSAFSSEGGPCYVEADGSTVTLNPWALNNDANVLFIDQPVSAGFSYTTAVNGTISLVTNMITPLEAYGDSVPESNETLIHGTFSNPDPLATTSTSYSGAGALWHFFEHWLTTFPEYQSSNKNIGIWGNSYAGTFVPATAGLLKQNIDAAPRGSPLREWTVDNIGITNGPLDLLQTLPYSPAFTYNNTYESLITEEQYMKAEEALTSEGGCNDMIKTCRAIAAEGDPNGAGLNETVNLACVQATAFCFENVLSTYTLTDRYWGDIAVTGQPCEYYYPVVPYLNQEHVLRELGAAINFTYISNIVMISMGLGVLADPSFAEVGTGDTVRYNSSDINYLLDNDVKVALVHGDLDTRCPWTTGEAYALAVNYSNHEAYQTTGFEYVATEGNAQSGAVRQYDGLSFSRVFLGGHAVSAYQPEAVYQIFNRTINGLDVATGQRNASGGYGSSGPQSSWDMFNGTLPKDAENCMVGGKYQSENTWPLPLATGEEGANGTESEAASGTGSGSQSSESSTSAASSVKTSGALAVMLAAGLWLLI